MKKLDNLQSVMEALKDFLEKEDSTLDKYDLLTKRVYLTVRKPEPQAAEFAKILKHMADSFTGFNWKILYK